MFSSELKRHRAQEAEQTPRTAGLETEPFLERHYTVHELAAAWSLSEDTIRRLFDAEPGVIVIAHPRRGKRQYKTLRIPASVAERVYCRISNGNGTRCAPCRREGVCRTL